MNLLKQTLLQIFTSILIYNETNTNGNNKRCS